MSVRKLAFPIIISLLGLTALFLGYFLYSGGFSLPDPERRQELGPKGRVFDLVIKGGTIIDGTGGPSFLADLGIDGEEIAFIGDLRENQGSRVIDASGLVVSPGFINPHSHIDQTILEEREVVPSLLQGITTEIVGMDGESTLDLKGSFAAIFNQGGGISVNYGTFLGQGSLRRAVVGDEDRGPTTAEMAEMQAQMTIAMEEGAFGLSTGLEYFPGYLTPSWEIVRLAQIANSYGGIYTTHMRNEGPKILSAIDEALLVGREANIPVNISHLKISGGTNDRAVTERLTTEVITKLREARRGGQEVVADLYPYTTTYFKVNVPLLEVYGNFPDHAIFIMRHNREEFLNESLTDLAKARGIGVPELVEIILREDPETRVYIQNLSLESLTAFLKEEYVMIGVDAPTKSPEGVPDEEVRLHPRRYGTYPRVLSRFVREDQILSLEKAIYKMSGLAAESYRIPNRGKLEAGFFADIVIFDPEEIEDRATFSHPDRPPVGISYVLVNGQITVEEGRHTGVKAGRLVRPVNANEN